VPDDLMTRMRAAYARCTRQLSGVPMVTMAGQLDALAAAGADLDRAPDAYGGGLVAELEERVAGLLGKPAAAYFPTGTMAQQVALRIWSERTGVRTVALHPDQHLEQHERYAYQQLTGLRSVWPTREPRQPTAAEVAALDEPYAALVVELPLREAGFLLPGWDELVALTAAARPNHVHFDGARLWEAAVGLGHDLATVADLADSVYVSFYKTLGAMSGAALAGPADFVATAKAWRHRYGGQLFTQWPAVVGAMAGLDHELPRLPEYVAHARTVARALAGLPGAVVHPDPPHTHQFQLHLPYPAAALNEAAVAVAERDGVRFIGGWRDRGPGVGAYCEVTVAAAALDWTAADVAEVGARFLAAAEAA
jgi:threonine aldolase